MAEAPNTLLSVSNLTILDLLCEGPISGLIYKSTALSGDPLLSTYYDEVPVRNLDGSYNYNVSGVGYSFGYTLGTSDQTGIAGFQKVESVVPLSSNTRIANPPAGGGPYKTVTASFNTSTYPDADAIKVTVRVPALFSTDSQGNINGYELTYAVDIALNNGPFITQGDQGITINGKCTQPYLQTTYYVLPKTSASYNSWRVRVRRVTQNILLTSVQNEIYVDTIAVVSSSLYAYPNSVIVGTSINASQFSSVPARSYEVAGLLVSIPSGYTPTQYSYGSVPFTRSCGITSGEQNVGTTIQAPSQLQGITIGTSVSGNGLAPNSIVTFVSPGTPDYYFSVNPVPTGNVDPSILTFYPTTLGQVITPATYPNVWNGSFQTGVWTDNPAWVFYDLMTNPTHGLGDYIPASSVDKWTLYQISQFCDQMVDNGAGGLEPQFTCNCFIQQPDDAYSVLLNLASTFRGMLYYANGTIHAVQSQNTPPVYSFTNANVVDGSFSYSDTAKNTRSTVAIVKWVDPSNNYRENVEYIEDIDGILRYGYQEKQMTAFACTSRGQAYRLGSWALTTERLLTETVTFQTSLEGLYIKPGDNFAIYDNFRNNQSQGGRIAGFHSGRSVIYLDRPVNVSAGVTYSFTAVTPKAVYDGTGDITGSNQIDLIRNSQIESFQVASAPGQNQTSITISGQFSPSLYIGSPWILSASGNTGVFNKASFYTCLATSEVEPGKIEVLGLQANSGIQFAISTGYSVIPDPPNSGDNTSIPPPSNLQITQITGSLPNNTFYTNLNLTWLPAPSNRVASYVVSGLPFNSGAYDSHNTAALATGYSYPITTTGLYSFKVAAVSIGGVYSSFISNTFTVSSSNPFGKLSPLSGVFIYQDFDPRLFASGGPYTGYVGTQPGFQWNILQDNNGNSVVHSALVTGYRIRISGLDGSTNLLTTPIVITGAQNNQYVLPPGFLYTGLVGGPQRGFDFIVDPLDVYGNILSGAHLKVNNPYTSPPFGSGFVGFNGGLVYNITPDAESDLSGVYLWANQSKTFTPTFANYNYSSNNFAGNAQISPNTGFFWTWFSVIDTFGASGNPIYGPISGDSNGVFQTFQFDISSQISGAFSLLTGMITQETIARTGADYQNLLLINGLSGQVTGLPGVVNTALSVRVDNAVVNSSGALSTQINAVQASVNSVSATVGSLQSALATTGGSLASWITNLGAITSGQNASVQIGAQAFVTGQVNGLGGAAVATWGFNLNANGKVVSMKATSSTFGGVDYGVISFSGASLQSETFVQGSKGWRIDPTGNAEFNNVVARGTFTGGAGSAVVSINADGLQIGSSADREIQIVQPSQRVVSSYLGTSMADFGIEQFLGNAYGSVNLYDGNGNNTVNLIGFSNGKLRLGYNGTAFSADGGGNVVCTGTLTVHNTDAIAGALFNTIVPTWNDSATEQYFGVTTPSKFAAGFGTCSSDHTIYVCYDWDNSTTTSGSFVARKTDGTAFNGTIRFSYLLLNR